MRHISTGYNLTRKSIRPIAIVAVLLVGSGPFALAAQDRYTLQVPNGLSFSEIKGYENWQDVAVSATATSIKAILANPIMIKAYRDGVPANGKLFPEGSQIVKIEWAKAKNPVSPYFVEVPTTIKTISFIVKDSKRFPDTHGWAYAQFAYDARTDTFKPSVTGTKCGYACHTAVSAQDYIFTAYPKR